MIITGEGPTKGMKLVLENRGVNIDGMNAEKMHEKLREMHDFKYEKTKLETLFASHGYTKVFFFPNFTVS